MKKSKFSQSLIMTYGVRKIFAQFVNMAYILQTIADIAKVGTFN